MPRQPTSYADVLYALDRDRETCVYCGWNKSVFVPAGLPRRIHVDHIIPASRGGVGTRENLVCACSRCNLYKGDKTPEEAGMELRFLGERLEYICGSIFEIRLDGDPE